MVRVYTESVPSERMELDGKIYRRYPQSPRKHLRNYFSRSGSFYHVALWIKHHGPVPDGYHVHHKDGDTTNNDISNLECLSAAHHAAAHSGRGKGEKQAEHLERIRPLTKAWHASPEGLAWHADNARKSWEHRKEHELTCSYCGAQFTSPFSDAKFCGRSCGNKQWMRDHPEYNQQKKARRKARLQLNGG